MSSLISPNSQPQLHRETQSHLYMNPNASTSQHQQLQSVELHSPKDEDLPEPVCGGCKKLIDEESADAGVIHFA